MFTSIMRVLHEMLPCSRNFFSMKRKYRMAQRPREDGTERRTKVKEIASPRMVRGLSLGKSPTARGTSRGDHSVGSGTNDFSSRMSNVHLQNQN